MSPRIGIDNSGDAAAWPLRFFLRNNRHVELTPSTTRGTATGAPVPAEARRLVSAEDHHAARLLRRKHPLLHGILVPLLHRVGRAKTGHTVHFEVTPSS